MGERCDLQRGMVQVLWKRERFTDFQLRKEEPPALREGFNYVLIVRCLLRQTYGKELLCLTEDTVDLGTADWADALCHATT
jgi:hypothetical protein